MHAYMRRGPHGTGSRAAVFACRTLLREFTMIKALLTPIILGLAVALLIRLAMAPRRAY